MLERLTEFKSTPSRFEPNEESLSRLSLPTMSTTPTAAPRTTTLLLNSKEKNLARHALAQYDKKQYKTCLASCSSLLKTAPQHGETVCLKALVTATMHPVKREECLAAAKKGVSLDFTSSVVWHLYALLQRIYRLNKQAEKSFKQALRREKDEEKQLSLRKELVLVQMQNRDFEAALLTRTEILTTGKESRNMSAWLGLRYVNY